MRIASYNVENLFERAAIMNLASWEDGKQVLEDYAELCDLLKEELYTPAVKKQIITLADRLGIKSTGKSRYVELREVRGKLFRRPKGKAVEIAVNGRDEWVGWLELVKEQVKEAAFLNTAKVLAELSADIIGVVEAEDRIGLKNFSNKVLPQVQGEPYEHIMLIDGNDERGIDVGLMTRSGLPIEYVRSHVDDRQGKSTIFSRDCPEYCVRLGSGQELFVLLNHYKSKGYGGAAASNARRKLQAKTTRAIYDRIRGEGKTLIAILGDFNDTPDSDPLKPLLQDGSDLRDVFTHPNFDNGGRPGTHGNCTASAKLDYILLSPGLWSRVSQGGVNRKGMWGGTNGTLWPHFPEVGGPADVASDHAAVWVDLNIN